MPSGGGTNYIGTVLTMNVEDFITNAHQARMALNDLRREFEASQYGGNRWRDSINGIAQRMKYLQDSINIEDRLIKSYNSRIEELSKNYEQNKSSIDHLREGIDNANISINRYTKQLDDCQKMLDKMWYDMEEADRPINQLTQTIREQEKELGDLIIRWRNVSLATGEYSTDARKLKEEIETLNNSLQENRNLLSSIQNADPFAKVVPPTGTDTTPEINGGFTVPRGILANLGADILYSMLYRVGDAFRSVIQTGIDFESAFMGVRRTVEGTEEDFRVLRNELLAMGSSVTSSITDIANIASLAGQMGIPVEQISEFTRVMIMLGDTTNITAEEAGDSLARLANLLNLTTDDFERMGSTIVQLGNTFPTTESEIASMASRLAGTANMLNISAEDVFGLANAISALGLEAEMGGNAVSKTLREIQLAVENGTERLDIFAEVAGMSVNDFVTLFTKDATEAFRRFVNGLGSQSDSVIQILSELNITELRQVDTLSRLATNTDTLNNSLEVARNAWDENIALSVEAGKRYSTTESQIEFMRNAWSQTATTIETALNPAIRWGVNILTDLAEWLNGNRLASEQLDRSLDILTSSLADVAEQQGILKGAIDDTNYSMYVQGIIATNDAMINSAQQLTDSLDNAEQAYNRLYSEEYTDPTGTYDENLLSVLNTRINGLMEYAKEFGYATYQELIDAFNSGSDDFVNKFNVSQRDNIHDAIQQYYLAYNDVNNAYKTINDNVASVMNFAQGLSELLDQNVMTMQQVGVLSSMMGDEYTGIVYNLVNAFQNEELSNSADSWAYNLIQSVQENEEDVAHTVGTLTDGINSAFLQLANPETRDGVNLNLLAMMIMEKDYLTQWQDELRNATDQNNELADEYSQSVVKFADLKEDFLNSRTETIRLSEYLGLSDEESERALLGVYESFIRTLNAQLTNYDNLLKNLTEDDERYKEAQTQRLLVEEELDRVSKERLDLFGNLISEQNEYSQIQENYRDEIRQIAEQEAILGDEYDDVQARADLARQTFEKIIALDPSERGEGWETFLSMLVYWMGRANDEGNDVLDTANRIIEKFTETENIELGLGNVTDPKVLESLKSSIGTTSQSVIKSILGLGDLDALVASGAISQDISDQLNQILADAEENVALYGNKKTTTKSGDWFTRWFNASQTAETQEFADGLQSMMNQIADIWDNIGAGILDVINGWYDAQINAIDAESERLKQSLEENLDLIEQNSNIRENTLRKQLQEGAIDEETYYRESAKASYEAEAQKQLAQQKTADMQEKLQKEKEEIERKQFEADKANSIADVIISTAQAIASAYGVNPIYGAVMSAVLSAIGAAQIATIASQKYTPALATGGIVTAPTTALIGEAGKEAVLPLEQNTDWMDELAQRIGSIITSDRINTAIDRTMNKDGEVVDKTSNMQFTQIINSPKALSRKEIYRDTRRLVRMVDRRIS